MYDTIGILLSEKFGIKKDRRKLRRIDPFLTSFKGLGTLFFSSDISKIHLKMAKGLQLMHGRF